MATKTAEQLEDERLKAEEETRKHGHEAVGAGVGALSGAALGAIGGPPGAVVGAVLGIAAGAVATWALEAEKVDENAREEKLDEEIGVMGGDIGVPGLKHPPAQRATYSSAAMGAGTSTETDEEDIAEGPIVPPTA
jgi:hypothetical protein